MSNTSAWDQPDATPLEDVRWWWVQCVGIEDLRKCGFGPGKIWFDDMTVEEAIEKYGGCV